MSNLEGNILNTHINVSEINIISKGPALIQQSKQRSSKKALPPVPKFSDNIEIKPENEIQFKISEEKTELDHKSKKNIIEEKLEQKKLEPKPSNTSAFAGKINLDFINKLYNEKKELQKEHVEKPETKQTQVISINAIQQIKDEYDPARPNDYETIVKERELLRIKAEEEEEDRQRELERNRIIEEENQGINQEGESQSTEAEEISTEEKVLRMLEKQGWKMGEGLGKYSQGMTTPLIAKKTASNTAVIVNSSVDMTAVLPPEVVAKKLRESLYNIQPTKVIVLLNMVSPAEVDETLQEEVANECSLHGLVQDVVVVQMTGVPEEESIRIFVEFDKKESAQNAFHNLHGRAFAGRTVYAKFYDEQSFLSHQYYIPL